MLTTLQIIGGLTLLFLGGEALVRGAVALSRLFGLSAFVIGLTVVAYGTSAPELVISLQAAFDGYPDIAFGNVVGSNISNILCVIGATAIIYPITIDKKISQTDSAIMLGVTLLLFALAFTGAISMWVGLLFVVLLSVYTAMVFTLARKKKDHIPDEATQEIEAQVKLANKPIFAIGACVLGAVLLMLGGDLLVRGAVTLAKHFGLSQAVIGLTLVAFGGSAPELITSVVAAFHRRADIVLGNVLGSNLFNMLGILGVVGIVHPVTIAPSFLQFDLPILSLVTALLVLLIYTLKQINRWLGVLLFGGYVGYIGYLVV